MPAVHARSTVTLTAWPSLRRQRDESTTWDAISRALSQAASVASQHCPPGPEHAPAIRTHFAAARFLYERIAARYVTDARTGLGRAWRRRQVRRSDYTRAFEQAATYLFDVEMRRPGAYYLPPLFKAASWSPLPLLDRHGRHRAPVAA